MLVKTGSIVGEFRTLVVEDNKPFLDFVTSTLRRQPNLQIVGEVQNGIEAVERAEALQPDLILLDIGLPGLNGIEAAHRIRKLAPDARIVFLTQETSDEIVYEAFNLGAWGYVIKAQAGKELPLAIETILSGKKFVSDGLNGRAHVGSN
jgi:two-component system nitrate/nitrite response regulator NarL